jgi:hypothetical protein
MEKDGSSEINSDGVVALLALFTLLLHNATYQMKEIN